MSQKPSYEFEEDDPPKPERRKFIPGLDAPSPAPVPSTLPAPGPGPAPAPAAVQPPPPAAPPAPTADDPDLKPGSRKDLWPCPHCGTKNKPDRTRCRSCGKAPGDARDKPFWQRPSFLGGAVGGFALVAVLWFATRPDLSLKAPGRASFDIGGSRGPERELAGRTFAPRGRLSVCGRVAASRPTPGIDGMLDVVLLLGAVTDAAVETAMPVFNNERIDQVPAGAQVLHLMTGEKLDLAKGAWLSAVGEYGQLSDGAQLVRPAEDGYTLVLEQVRQ